MKTFSTCVTPLLVLLSLWGVWPCKAQKFPLLSPQGPLVPRLDIPPNTPRAIPPPILKRVQSIRPGMMRTQLSKVFPKGYPSDGNRWVYVYSQTVTPKGTNLKYLILVKVCFKPHWHPPRDIFDDGLDSPTNVPGGGPNDLIATISQPYVDTTIGPIRID